MKKSVYSIVLMDDVIRAVDKKAYMLGTSRSNLINQILAESLSCITPEMRMREIFSSLEDMLTKTFQIQQCRSDSLMTLRTALEYKYRPTINYKVELARSPNDYVGTLRVKIRTQSSSLLSLFNGFFMFWTSLEARILSMVDAPEYICELSPDRFSRKLIHVNGRSGEATGEALCAYITFLDKVIKLYFSAPNEFNAVTPQIEREYTALLQHTIV